MVQKNTLLAHSNLLLLQSPDDDCEDRELLEIVTRLKDIQLIFTEHSLVRFFVFHSILMSLTILTLQAATDQIFCQRIAYCRNYYKGN